jgi:hypothetical protein
MEGARLDSIGAANIWVVVDEFFPFGLFECLEDPREDNDEAEDGETDDIYLPLNS